MMVTPAVTALDLMIGWSGTGFLLCVLGFQFLCTLSEIVGQLHEMDSARIIQRKATGQSQAQLRFFSIILCIHGKHIRLRKENGK
jgi:hypothetical protein